MSDTKLQRVGHTPTPHTEEEPSGDDDLIEVGQWFWVASDTKKKLSEAPDDCWLGCVVHVGSNHARFEGPHTSHSTYTARIHFDVFWDQCRREPNPEAYIDSRIKHFQGKVHTLMGKIKEITARLGVSPSPELTAGSETKALAKVGQGQDMGEYKAGLVKAKEKTLPALFEAIKAANDRLSTWMTAQVIPLKAQASGMEGVISKIEDRIFSVQLYAGLTEEVVQFADGEPAELADKIHLMQRRCYMDEECLAQYQTGGMEFKDIDAFEQWLAKPENRDRVMPFPRTIVAFKVRRKHKKREMVNLSDFFNIANLEVGDKLTFLYIRNGERLYCMRTDIEFDEKLFPDLEHSQLDGSKLWASTRWGSDIKIITDAQYQGMKEDYAREVKKHKAEKKAYDKALKSPEAKARAKADGKKKPDASHVDVPWPGHGWHTDDSKEYTPYNPGNVYYDDISGKIADDIKMHNRIALIIQGLLDRSPMLHPHPPWQIWTHEGFAAGLELIYDDSRALSAGEKPDFEAYRKRLNLTLKAGSVTVGQEDAWERYEGAKESRRLDNDYRIKSHYRPSHHKPYGNPGPGGLTRISRFSPRARKATFAWERERANAWNHPDKSDHIRTTFTCPAGCLLNVDAYTPGDFHIFFNDPRTRLDYLRWAPLLLEAEEFHAGNREVKDPVPPEQKTGSTWEGRQRYQMTKRRKSLMGKAVRLTREITTQGGKTHKAGSLWRVCDARGNDFHITGIKKDGTYDRDRGVRNLSYSDLQLDDTIPNPHEE